MRIIFVCTGNTCRSPLAEVMARDLAEKLDLGSFEFGSAGVAAYEGEPASHGSQTVARERGLDLSKHRSRHIDSVIKEDTVYLAMADSHLKSMKRLHPELTAFLLSEYASDGASQDAIEDPFGREVDQYRAVADQMETFVRMLVNNLRAKVDIAQ